MRVDSLSCNALLCVTPARKNFHIFSAYFKCKLYFKGTKMSNVLEGTVKWFNDEKGYGFISQDNGEGDLFVHFRQVNNPSGGRVSLQDGQKVTYTIGEGQKGPQAENVTPIN